MALIRFNVANNDPVSGKRVKYTSDEIRLKEGRPIEFIGYLSYHETNDSDAVAVNNTVQAKRIIEKIYENWPQVSGKSWQSPINSVTKVYAPALLDENGNPIANVTTIGEYFELKVINSFPTVAGGDPFKDMQEGLAREMVAIRQVNGELPS